MSKTVCIQYWSTKRKYAANLLNMDEGQKYYNEQNKQDTSEHLLYECIYKKILEKTNLQTKNRSIICWDRVLGRWLNKKGHGGKYRVNGKVYFLS